MEPRLISVVCKDDHIVPNCDLEMLQYSEMIKTSFSCDEETNTITLSSVDHIAFAIIYEFWTRHHAKPYVIIPPSHRDTAELKKLISPYHYDWIHQYDIKTICNVLFSANYLGDVNLVNLCSAVISVQLRHHSTDSLMKLFQIKNLPTLDEIQSIKNECNLQKKHPRDATASHGSNPASRGSDPHDNVTASNDNVTPHKSRKRLKIKP